MTQINKKIIYYILLTIKLNRTLRRRLIKKIYFVFRAKTLAMPVQMCYTIVTVRETEPNRAAAVKRTKGKTMNTMNTMRENLIDRMIKIYGFEHPAVIHFTELCERLEDTEINDTLLRLAVEAHEKFPNLD